MIAEADQFVKRKIRKRRQKALTAENYGGTLFHGENMPSNRISPILDGIRQTIAVTVKLRGLFGMQTMPLNSHLDYEQWDPHAAHVGRSLTGVLLPYCLLLSQAVFLLYLGGQLVMQIQQADRLNC